jgi:hypothetical protein
MFDLSVVYVSSMPDRRHYDCPLIFIEDDTPIPDAETHAVTAFESLHVAMPSCSELG